MEPRKVHAGKSPAERDAYLQGLKVSTPPNPTYRKHTEQTTDAVQDVDVIAEGTTKEGLRPYVRESKHNLKDIVIAVVATVIGGALLIFLIDMSRQMGALQERSDALMKRADALESRLGAVSRDLDSVRIDTEVLKRTTDQKSSK